MVEVEKDIADGKILALIGQYLRQPIMDDMKSWEPEQGTPQGAVISPLLANIYLHPVDVVLRADGYHMVRYADDLVILCKTQGQAERALEHLRTLMQARSRPSPLAKRLLSRAGSFHHDRGSRKAVSITLMLSTGEPDAGDPPVRFGGRGRAVLS